MSVERMKFSDLNGSVETTTFGNHRKGCYVTIVSGFILALLAVVIAVGVGLIVHFASPQTSVQCHCKYPSGLPPKHAAHGTQNGQTAESVYTPDELWDTCLNISTAKNECKYTYFAFIFSVDYIYTYGLSYYFPTLYVTVWLASDESTDRSLV